MPRPQRMRRQSPRLEALPYKAKNTARRRRRLSGGTSLSDDALAVVFSKLPGAADVVRCAATYAQWGRVVATHAATISRLVPPPLGRFLPQVAAGVFHLQRDGPTARTRSTPGAPQPCFLPLASGRRLLGCQAPTFVGSLFFNVDAAVFDYSRPVACRNGRLVLELHGGGGGDSLTLCVCSPVTGDAVVLPPMGDRPANYACALLTGEDDLHQRRGAEFFRLLLVYNRPGGLTALRCYSSDIGGWGAEARSPVKVSSRELRHTGPAVVLHGAAFWPLDHGALAVAVRPNNPNADDPPAPERQQTGGFDVHLLPYDCPHDWTTQKRLGISPDNRLFLVYIGTYWHGPLLAKISYFNIPRDDIGRGKKESSSDEVGVPMRQMEVEWRDFKLLKLRWVGEKSGLVLFTIASGRHSGTHGLNLREGTVEKLADEGHSWGNLIGFEVDWATYLASLPHTQN
ncbi:hypothetical protein U9M48_032947 [Paspalum notatum var. saurae]|uniref:F-box domain-containing protein n=1 Tax=Paspalum notatum var. saurae TaxID=547442 RepID=A0AAQ3X524_PASNO